LEEDESMAEENDEVFHLGHNAHGGGGEFLEFFVNVIYVGRVLNVYLIVKRL
jgi:hypothetical protein